MTNYMLLIVAYVALRVRNSSQRPVPSSMFDRLPFILKDCSDGFVVVGIRWVHSETWPRHQH